MFQAQSIEALTVLMLVISLGLIAGCTGPEGPAGPAGGSPVYVTGTLSWPGRVDSTGVVRVEVIGVSGIAAVYVNDIEIPFFAYSTYYLEDFPISPGDSARLWVEHTKQDGGSGVSQANVRLPTDLVITSHDTSGTDTIPYGVDLTVTWTSSAGADAYSVNVSCNCAYRDTANVDQTFHYHLRDVFADTSITFPSTDIFPDTAQMDTMYGWSGNLYFESFDGPWQPGETGNVTGDGIGTFHAQLEGPRLHLEAIRN